MDIVRFVRTPSVRIECPHCGQVEEDAFELFDDDSLQQMRCTACDHEFFVDVMECSVCGRERLFSWMERPAADKLVPLVCSRCTGRARPQHESPGPSLDLLE